MSVGGVGGAGVNGDGTDRLRLSGRAADVPTDCGFSPGASNLSSNSGGGLEVDGRDTDAGEVIFSGRGREEDRLLGRRLGCCSFG